MPAFLSDRQYYSLAAILLAVSLPVTETISIHHANRGPHSHHVSIKAVESSNAIQHEAKVALAVRARYHGA